MSKLMELFVTTTQQKQLKYLTRIHRTMTLFERIVSFDHIILATR